MDLRVLVPLITHKIITKENKKAPFRVLFIIPRQAENNIRFYN